MGLKRARFATMEDIKSNAMAELQKIPKEASAGDSGSGNIDGERERERVCAHAHAKVIR
jgi:hypothetical protein